MSDAVEQLKQCAVFLDGDDCAGGLVRDEVLAELARLRLTAAEREAVETARMLFAQGGKQFDHAADRDRAATLQAFLDRHAKGGGA